MQRCTEHCYIVRDLVDNSNTGWPLMYFSHKENPLLLSGSGIGVCWTETSCIFEFGFDLWPWFAGSFCSIQGIVTIDNQCMKTVLNFTITHNYKYLPSWVGGRMASQLWGNPKHQHIPARSRIRCYFVSINN